LLVDSVENISVSWGINSFITSYPEAHCLTLSQSKFVHLSMSDPICTRHVVI